MGIAATPAAEGYWLVGANGVVTTFGDGKSLGSLSASSTTRVVATDAGYRLITAQGYAIAFRTTPTG